jgi:hypothetical protein
LCKSSRADKTATVIRKIFQIILWLTAGAYGVVGVLAITGALGSAYAVFGSMILIIGAMAAITTFLANKWRGWLIVAPLILCLGLPIVLFAAFWIDMEKGEVHRRQFEEEVRSGRHAFGDQPAVLAVAQAISANIRTRPARPRRPFQICRRPGGTGRRCFVGPSGKRGSVRNWWKR